LAKADEILGGAGKAAGEAKPAATHADAKKDEPAKAEWGESFEKAIEVAAKEKKLVVANFTGSDWCPWCQKLEGEIFATPEFQEWAKHVVLLLVDFPDKKPQSDEQKAANK